MVRLRERPLSERSSFALMQNNHDQSWMLSMDSIRFGDQNSGSQVGINNGVMNIMSKPPEARPKPLSTVPFPHDPDFVSRDGILNAIHEKSSIPGSRVVLVGLGGVGKTRLVIEYCHRARQQSTDAWVFWVHASTAARCEESLRNLADRAKIPGREDRNVNIFQLFGNWLQDEHIGEWILVLDNVDDDELLRTPEAGRADPQANAKNHMETSTQPPLRYLLSASNGSIIVTSRNRAVALEIAGHGKHLIDVQPMDMAEALDLMQHKLDSRAEDMRADLVKLVEELEFMPLAIIQAASYITHRSPRCSVLQYLEKLQQSDRQATKLLKHEGLQTDRDWQAKNSILLTWQISFDHIQRVRPSAADLLSLMSFFDWQGIPEDLLRAKDTIENNKSSGSSGESASRSHGGDMESSSEDESEDDADDSFESDITTLRDYSFITMSENCMIFTMHRLVQLTARTWLKAHDREEEWKEQSITNLDVQFPTAEFEHWERCRTLFPHVRSAMSHRPKSQLCLQIWAGLLYKGAWYAYNSGNIPDAREMAYASRQQRAKILGLEDEETVSSAEMLAAVYQLEGRWREAEQLEIQVMETRKAKLGEDHLDTVKSMHHLAATYREQGRWEEAEQLQIPAMEINMIKLGHDHPDTITSMHDLASTYHRQGRWEEAEKLQVQVLEMTKRTLSENHPDALLSTHNLVLTYYNQGRWNEAEKLQIPVIEMSMTTFGEDHPHTLSFMDTLASIYCKQGREEAEQLQIRVIEMTEKKFGMAHHDTISSVNQLAVIYHAQGRWKEAEKLQMQVVEMSKMRFGEDHPDTLTIMHNLASTYYNQDRLQEAEQLQRRVVEMSKIKLGEDHPNTLNRMSNLAHFLFDAYQDEAAVAVMAECARLRERRLGPDHPDTILAKSTLNKWRGHSSSSNKET